jgi:uncharacterized protein YjbI with pentapeptide repeats
MVGARLVATSLNGADMRGVDFDKADIRGANFRDTNLVRAKNLSKARGLKETLHLDEAKM